MILYLHPIELMVKNQVAGMVKKQRVGRVKRLL